MPQLPLLPPRQVIKVLEREGFRLRNSRGTERIYKKRGEHRSWTVTVPTHSKEIPRGTLRSIIDLCGWTEEEFLELVERHC
jgi:predicted RNA binding protein YcfA (HicA-like mRNA interferase family)